jgi:hypothetical protein
MYYKVKVKKGKKGEPDTEERTLHSSCIGEGGATEMLEQYKMSEILNIVEPKSFERNRVLIHLDNIPADVVSRIDKAIKETVKQTYFDLDYPVTGFDKVVTTQSALYDAGRTEEASLLSAEIEQTTEPINEKPMEEMTSEELIEYAKKLKEERDTLLQVAKTN